MESVNQQRLAILTIDDSPSVDLQIRLKHLKERSLTAILFCRGDYLEKRPELALQAIHEKHIIGNHAFSHTPFSNLTLAEGEKEISKTEQIIDRIYEQSDIRRPAKVFRFPYGDKGNRDPTHSTRAEDLQKILKEFGFSPPKLPNLTNSHYQSINAHKDLDWFWTFDAMEYGIYREWAKDLHTIDDVYNRMNTDSPDKGIEINNGTSDEIILIHDHSETTDVFPDILDRLLQKNCKFVSPEGHIDIFIQ
ncbi:MAG: polysaccharide deacetylase family protein [Kiritimatiellales bacterium]|nr:polysaccharide deacetylase family protein [Kiritimatiellales bacterium]